MNYISEADLNHKCLEWFADKNWQIIFDPVCIENCLHGIGVLLLNTESLFDSQILIPARERSNIDWQSVNRIAEGNADFKACIEQVSIYNQTGRLINSMWQR